MNPPTATVTSTQESQFSSKRALALDLLTKELSLYDSGQGPTTAKERMMASTNLCGPPGFWTIEDILSYANFLEQL